jgi:hypothetical protein
MWLRVLILLQAGLCSLPLSASSHRSYSSCSHSCSYTPRSYSRSYSYTPRSKSRSRGYASDVTRDSPGRIKRSTAAKDFKRQHPCPSMGRGFGSCPDYVMDHVRPLECGGADAPYNIQWQTIAEGKAKDKTERYCW